MNKTLLLHSYHLSSARSYVYSHFNPFNNPLRLVLLLSETNEIKFREDYVNYPSSYVNKRQSQDMTPSTPQPPPPDT